MPDLPDSESADQLAAHIRPAFVRNPDRARLNGFLNALLARLAEAERLQVRAEDRSHDQFMARKAVEAERDRLEAALEQIEQEIPKCGDGSADSYDGTANTVILNIVRTALAADEWGGNVDAENAALAADEEGGSSHDRQGDDRAGVQGAGPDDPEVA